MPRAKRGIVRRRRVKKALNSTEGFTLRRKNTYKRAIETLRRAGAYAYRDRRNKKRNFRSLWINRISAAAASNDISYSRLIAALDQTKIQINRKMLADIAIIDPMGFKAIVDHVRSAAPAH